MRKLLALIILISTVMVGCNTKTATDDVYMSKSSVKEPQGLKEPTLIYKAETEETEIIYTEYNNGFQGDDEYLETYLKVVDKEDVERDGKVNITYSIRPEGVQVANLYGSGYKEESSGTKNYEGIERLETYLNKESIKINREFYPDDSERDMNIEVAINEEDYKLERIK